MFIKLNEIREGGEDFDYSRQDTEMAAVLDDILKGNSFQAHVRITPAGQAFDLRGSITAKLPEVCSFCAKEFQLPITRSFHDILMLGTKAKCDLKGSGNDFSEDELEAVELDSNQFNISESLHEQLALAEPIQPICKDDCKGLCAICGSDLNEEGCHCEVASKTPRDNAFSVLKSLKLN